MQEVTPQSSEYKPLNQILPYKLKKTTIYLAYVVDIAKVPCKLALLVKSSMMLRLGTLRCISCSIWSLLCLESSNTISRCI